jgi:hypothetical protein
VELEFLRRLLPQLRALLEKKRRRPAGADVHTPLGGAFRSQQEQYFGKYFSMN